MNNYKKQFVIFLILTIILGGLWGLFSKSSNTNLILLGKISLYLAIPFWIYACINYVLDRGYHWTIGFIIGLLTFLKGIGMIILLILPSKNKGRLL